MMNCRSEEKVLCPWCGAEMFDDAEASSNGKYVWAYMRCVSCGATGPMFENSEGTGLDENTRASARAAALRRYTPPIKPMTLEEFWKEDDPLWVEHKNGALYVGDFYAAMSTRAGWDVQTLGSAKTRLLLEDYYGRTWRCWERKPTDEERSAAEWEK